MLLTQLTHLMCAYLNLLNQMINLRLLEMKIYYTWIKCMQDVLSILVEEV